MASSSHQVLSALVLFDIDGTLVRKSGPQHRQALVDAIRKVTGRETTMDGVPVAGMLDRDILRAMLRAAGAAESLIRREMPAIVEHAQRVYVRTCPDIRTRVCPGARGVLYKLWRRGIPAGLVSGNLTRIGWRKLQQAGLRSYFRFGAFAELASDRAGLVRIAIRHARRERWIEPNSPIVLVGDHPNDIRAARVNGIRAVAVATGVTGGQELARHSPDLLLPDLRGVRVDDLLGLS